MKEYPNRLDARKEVVVGLVLAVWEKDISVWLVSHEGGLGRQIDFPLGELPPHSSLHPGDPFSVTFLPRMLQQKISMIAAGCDRSSQAFWDPDPFILQGSNCAKYESHHPEAE